MSWTAILILGTGAYLLKVVGVFIGNRLPDGPLHDAVRLLPPALFCGLIALQTFERDQELVLDARAVGLLVAIIATVRKVPFLGVLVLATAATAMTRMLIS